MVRFGATDILPSRLNPPQPVASRWGTSILQPTAYRYDCLLD